MNKENKLPKYCGKCKHLHKFHQKGIIPLSAIDRGVSAGTPIFSCEKPDDILGGPILEKEFFDGDYRAIKSSDCDEVKNEN